MIVAILNGLTLWMGMYAITCCLFWYETGNVVTGLTMGLLSATLKTIWGLIHKSITRVRRVPKAVYEESM